MFCPECEAELFDTDDEYYCEVCGEYYDSDYVRAYNKPISDFEYYSNNFDDER